MIAHFLAQNPDFIPMVTFGFLFAFGLSFWGKAKQGCFTVSLYLYIFGTFTITLVVLPLLMPNNPAKAFLVLGFLVFHLKTVGRWLISAFYWVVDFSQERKRATEYQKQQRQWEAKRASQEHEQQSRYQQEQDRREQEANRRREEQRQHQENERKRRQKEQAKEPPARKPDTRKDQRSFEDILGLPVGWTQDDLKTAYRRECQRLHPDKWMSKPIHIQTIMEEEYKAVRNAYDKLKK